MEKLFFLYPFPLNQLSVRKNRFSNIDLAEPRKSFFFVRKRNNIYSANY